MDLLFINLLSFINPCLGLYLFDYYCILVQLSHKKMNAYLIVTLKVKIQKWILRLGKSKALLFFSFEQ